MTPTNSASILIFNNGNGHMTWAIDRHKKCIKNKGKSLGHLLLSYHTTVRDYDGKMKLILGFYNI